MLTLENKKNWYETERERIWRQKKLWKLKQTDVNAIGLLINQQINDVSLTLTGPHFLTDGVDDLTTGPNNDPLFAQTATNSGDNWTTTWDWCQTLPSSATKVGADLFIHLLKGAKYNNTGENSLPTAQQNNNNNTAMT